MTERATRTGPFTAGTNIPKGATRNYNLYVRDEDVKRFELCRRRLGMTAARAFEYAMDLLEQAIKEEEAQREAELKVQHSGIDSCLACAGGEVGHTCGEGRATRGR